jgi:hypothetical protein
MGDRDMWIPVTQADTQTVGLRQHKHASQITIPCSTATDKYFQSRDQQVLGPMGHEGISSAATQMDAERLFTFALIENMFGLCSGGTT